MSTRKRRASAAAEKLVRWQRGVVCRKGRRGRSTYGESRMALCGTTVEAGGKGV